MNRTDITLETFPHGDFRAGYRRIIDEHADQPFAVGRHGLPEVVIMPVALYQDLANAHRRLDEVGRIFPVLLAAAQAGVAFPSETLVQLGYQPEFDANKLAEFVSRFGVGPAYDEEGHPLSESRVALEHEPVEEDDSELIYRSTLPGV